MNPITPELKGLLQQASEGATTASDTEGQVYVIIKLPRLVTPSFQEPLPIRHFLFMAPMPTAAVIGWFFEITHSQNQLFRANVFYNIATWDQLRHLKQLRYQERIQVYYVDGKCQKIVIQKQIAPPSNAGKLLEAAMIHASEIPLKQYNWNQAIADFKRLYPLDDIATWHSL